MEGGNGGGCYCVSGGRQPSPFSCVSQSSASEAETNPPRDPLCQCSSATQVTNPPRPSEVSGSDDKKTTKTGEKESRRLLIKIFQLANFNLVSQGVIFTPFFGNPSRLKCQYRWLPVSLSLIAGLLNLSILIHMTWKYDRLTHERDGKCLCGSRPVKEKHERGRITSLFGLVMFVLFQVILLFGSSKILCSNSGSPQSCNIKNCFELCNDAGRCILTCLSTS